MGYRTVLWWVVAINGAMLVVEMAGALATNSTALMADAIDFFEDAAGALLTIAVLDHALRRRAAAGAIKGLLMLIPGIWFLVLTVGQIADPRPVGVLGMGTIGVLALVANLTCAMLLVRHRSGDSNMRSAWLSARNDAFANIAILIAAVAVAATSSVWPDIAAGAAIAAMNLHAAGSVLRQAAAEWRQGSDEV